MIKLELTKIEAIKLWRCLLKINDKPKRGNAFDRQFITKLEDKIKEEGGSYNCEAS